MGNICRSPTAEGVFRALVEREGLGDRIVIDSAGTHAWHEGEPPDARSQSTAVARGLDLSDLRARRVAEEDFERFDLVVAMDQDNYMNLARKCPDARVNALHLFMDFAPQFKTREVPDPYYGGPQGFEKVFDMVEAASEGLLAYLRASFPRLNGR
ncbi:MAG: low molecular weight phosphotyrosine protein phosphatase [Chromatiales bacterium]|nr:low molecular weight phosphotyrosine protein phosphatase [Chromatiales bacterium]